MDLPQAVDLNKSAIARIVAGLFALLGLTGAAVPGRIPRELHRSVARVLRPAESAVRRLILFLAKSIRVKASPARPMPAGLVRSKQEKPRLSFQLFDPRQPVFRQRPQPKTARAQPRISFFGNGEVRRISWGRELPPPSDGKADGLENSAHLVRRLVALKAALDDLPRQAKRLVRSLARRKKVPRLKLQGPLRPGRAPGWRKRPIEDIDRVLHECDWLAREILAPDSS